jgi:branched-subunit amino acid ABC-type transport system permease component
MDLPSWARWLLPVVVLVAIGFPLASANNEWPFVLTGISDGAVYSLAALGLVLTFKTSGIFNFAIGAQAAVSAYIFHSLRDSAGMPWGLAAVVTVLIAGVIGSLVLERIAFWLAEAPAVMKVVATIGLVVLLQSLLIAIYGPVTIRLPQFLPTHQYQISGTTVLASQIIVTILAIAATVGLYFFFRHHRIGVAMQAVVDDSQLLAQQGTSPIAVRRYAWGIGSCFVAISGMLIAPTLGVDVNTMLLLYIAAFGAAALGAFDNLFVTFVASVGIGVTSNVLSDRLGGQKSQLLASLYTQIPFLVLVAALLFLPRARLVQRGARRERKLRAAKPAPPRLAIPGTAGGITALVALPFLISRTDINQYSTAIGFAVVLMSLGLLLWSSGQISLCQMAFAAVGASTFAHAQSAGIPWPLALLCAGLVAIPVGAIVAIPSFRLSGVYLAVATFGFGLLFQNMLYTTSAMFGLDNVRKVHRPDVHSLGSDRGWYYTALGIAALCAFSVIGVLRSRLGRILRALAESPQALDAHGANTRRARLTVFCLSAFIAAIGGALIGATTGSAGGLASGPFGYFTSLALTAVLTFCGRRPILSPVLAAVAFQVVRIYPPFDTHFYLKYQGAFFGGLALAIAVFPGIVLPALRERGAERGTRSPVKSRVQRRRLATAEATR